MRIYTRRGDSGETGIWGGERLPKDHLRIEAMGSVDECNAALGVAVAEGVTSEVGATIVGVQSDLFVVGSDLMAPGRGRAEAGLPRLAREAVERLEEAIDQYEGTLPELRNFILPGGSRAGAHLHLARAVCRRAERQVTTLARSEAVSETVPTYLNRLSDLLFVLARVTNQADQAGDVIWTGLRDQ